MRTKQLFYVLGVIAVFGFLVNFFWETTHGAFLYAMHWESVEEYVRVIFVASLGDVGYLLLIYGGGALLFRDVLWVKRFTLWKALYIVAAGLLVAAGIEYNALYIAQKWSYSARMPMVFGVGLSPLLELATTGLVSFFAAARCTFARNGNAGSNGSLTALRHVVWLAVPLVTLGIVYLLFTPTISLPKNVPASATSAWNASIAIWVNGNEYKIPAGAGLFPVQSPVYSLNGDGVLFMHSWPGAPLTEKSRRLGEFFKAWGKDFSNTRLFEYKNGPEGAVSMTVNGEPNKEFDDYIIEPGDEIIVRYE